MSSIPPTVADQLWRSHASELLRFATGLVGPSDAEDVVTDAFIAAVPHLEGTRVANPRAYLFRTVANRAHDHRRADLRRQRRELAAAPRASSTEIDDHTDLREALADLSVSERAAVMLTYWEGLTERAVADTLGLSSGTVHKLLDRARTSLRRTLSEPTDERLAVALTPVLAALLSRAPEAGLGAPIASGTWPAPDAPPFDAGVTKARDQLGDLDPGKTRDALGEGKTRDALGQGKSRDALGEGKTRDALGEDKTRDALGDDQSGDALDGGSAPRGDGPAGPADEPAWSAPREPDGNGHPDVPADGVADHPGGAPGDAPTPPSGADVPPAGTTPPPVPGGVPTIPIAPVPPSEPGHEPDWWWESPSDPTAPAPTAPETPGRTWPDRRGDGGGTRPTPRPRPPRTAAVAPTTTASLPILIGGALVALVVVLVVIVVATRPDDEPTAATATTTPVVGATVLPTAAPTTVASPATTVAASPATTVAAPVVPATVAPPAADPLLVACDAIPAQLGAQVVEGLCLDGWAYVDFGGEGDANSIAQYVDPAWINRIPLPPGPDAPTCRDDALSWGIPAPIVDRVTWRECPTAPPAVDGLDQSTPEATVNSMRQAVIDGDPDRMCSLYWASSIGAPVTPELWPDCLALSQFILSVLQAGAEGLPIAESSTIAPDGQTATISPEQMSRYEPGGPVVLHLVDGRWFVELTDL